MRKACLNRREVRATVAGSLGRIACMRQAEIIDMSTARSNVQHMSKMIQIRNVPDEMHRALKTQAAAAGMNLSDYIKKELSWVTQRSQVEESFERARARGPLGLSTREVVELIREGRGD
jgi:antitoxin FitA